MPVAAAAGLAYFLTFIWLDVFPFFWYYGVPLAMLLLCAGAGIAALTYRPAVLARVGAAGVALAVALLPAGLAWGRGLERQTPLEQALVKGNWAKPWQYAHIGRDLRDDVGAHVPVKSPGEIGTLLFYCRCVLVDQFSDRARLVPRIREATRDNPLMRLNYRYLDVDALEMISPKYALQWRPGPDRSGRGWNVFSPTGHRALGFSGHLALREYRFDEHDKRGTRP